VGRTALLLMLGAVLLLYIPPVSHWFAQSETVEAQRLELHQLQVEHAELEARVRELRGPDAVEREARKLGMVRSGERPFVVEDLP
jgi:cell division protein FtsB